MSIAVNSRNGHAANRNGSQAFKGGSPVHPSPTKVKPQPVAELSQETLQLGLQEIPVELIDVNPLNVRDDWDNQEIGEMATTIREAGSIVQPVIVRAKEGRFELVSGERRLRGAKQLGMATIPGIVREMTDSEAIVSMMVENLQRKDLNAIQKARGLQLMIMPIAEGGAGKSLTTAARMFGHQSSWASNLIRLLKLPPAWQHRITTGEISETEARALVPYVDDPVVLKAVEKDMKINPWAWNTREVFERSLVLLVENPGEGGQKREEPPAEPARTPRGANSSSSIAVVAPTNRTVGPDNDEEPPVYDDTGLSFSQTVESICEGISGIETTAELQTIQEHLEHRMKELRGARGKK